MHFLSLSTPSSVTLSFSLPPSRLSHSSHLLSLSRLPPAHPLQNTYTNAEKLLEAAGQLAQSGECEEGEIYSAAGDLELRMQAFIQRVEQRKLLLDLAVSFYTHTKEVIHTQQGGNTHTHQGGNTRSARK